MYECILQDKLLLAFCIFLKLGQVSVKAAKGRRSALVC